MKWFIEYITSDSANILVENLNQLTSDWEVVGMGFPPILAERIVQMHNSSLDTKETKE